MNYPDDFINKIICGDCLEVMKDIPDNSIDLTVTSPPYDNLRDYKGYVFDFESIAKELYRITKIGGVVVWVVGDATINGSETGTSFKQALYFKEIGFNLHDTMIYGKDSSPYPSGILSNRYSQIFEYVFILSKGKPKTHNLIMDRKNNITTQTGSSYRQKDGTLKRVIPKPIKQYGVRGNIWYYSSGYQKSTKDKIAYQHPAIFPEKLAQDHILSWSNENDLVLDPMCGSGTTCKMAKKTGRQYIGIDTTPEYCEIARKRVNATPEPLFV